MEKPIPEGIRTEPKASFSEYIDPSVSLKERIEQSYDELAIDQEQRDKIDAFLNLLKVKHLASYEHSLRVGLLSKEIATFMKLDTKALFYAGLLHDCGKLIIPLTTLDKKSGWTKEDSANMIAHVGAGHDMLSGIFDFTAEVITWHHKFQTNDYPKDLPPLAHDYSSTTQTKIPFYGQLLALADQYDALHRINDHHGSPRALSGQEIKDSMLNSNQDSRALIEELYANNVLSTEIFS